MAVTNKQIMELYRAENNIPDTVELLTFASWKAKGYKVKKGERAKHKVELWKYRENKKQDEDGIEIKSGYCIHRNMNLFTIDQVEKI